MVVYIRCMLRPVDICVLLRLTLPGSSGMAFQQLGEHLGLSSSEAHASVERAKQSNLLRVEGREKLVNRGGLLEFLEHGLSYAFPAEKGKLTRGMATAYAAEPLKSVLQNSSEPPPVWPYAEGKIRGYSFCPLYKHAPDAAQKSAELYELFALTDALRDGRVRERKLAMKELASRIDTHG